MLAGRDGDSSERRSRLRGCWQRLPNARSCPPYPQAPQQHILMVRLSGNCQCFMPGSGVKANPDMKDGEPYVTGYRKKITPGLHPDGIVLPVSPPELRCAVYGEFHRENDPFPVPVRKNFDLKRGRFCPWDGMQFVQPQSGQFTD